MNRDFNRFNKYLNNLSSDVYGQPQDVGHTDFASSFLDWALSIVKTNQILDLGCGQGVCRPLLAEKEIDWIGVTIGEDYDACVEMNIPAHNWDMSFLPIPDNTYETALSRHSLEHSPFPVLTLMEWKRVVRGHLLVVLPSWEYWGYGGKNHYSVLNKEQWWYNFTRAGWSPIFEKELMTDDEVFMRHYLPHIQGKDREGLKFPGAPKPVEYWYILEPTKERTE